MVIVLVICLGICFGNFRMEHVVGFPFWDFQNISPNISPNMETISIANINPWNYHGRCFENVGDFSSGISCGGFLEFCGVHRNLNKGDFIVLLMGMSLGYVGKLIITIAYSWVWENWIFWQLFQTVINSGNDGVLGNRNMGECSCCSKNMWE